MTDSEQQPRSCPRCKRENPVWRPNECVWECWWCGYAITEAEMRRGEIQRWMEEPK